MGQRTLWRWLHVGAMGLCALLWKPAISVATQPGSWEIGLDMGAEFASFEATNSFPYGTKADIEEKIVDVPQGAFRAGYFLTHSLSLESSLGMSWSTANPGSHLTDWHVRLGFGTTYAFQSSSGISPFVSAGIATRYAGNSLTPVFGIPLEAGIRFRIGDAHIIRVQSGIIPWFERYNDPEQYWAVPVSIGWSYLSGGSTEGGAR